MLLISRINLIKIIHQNAPGCINDYHYFYMKVAIFYSDFLPNVNQKASIVACFQKFLRELSSLPPSKRVYYIIIIFYIKIC